MCFVAAAVRLQPSAGNLSNGEKRWRLGQSSSHGPAYHLRFATSAFAALCRSPCSVIRR